MKNHVLTEIQLKQSVARTPTMTSCGPHRTHHEEGGQGVGGFWGPNTVFVFQNTDHGFQMENARDSRKWVLLPECYNSFIFLSCCAGQIGFVWLYTHSPMESCVALLSTDARTCGSRSPVWVVECTLLHNDFTESSLIIWKENTVAKRRRSHFDF